VGWFGFNPGSELAADGAVGYIALTTLIAGATGAVFATITVWLKSGVPDVAMAGNGTLAGLVAITAGTANVSNWGAALIGALAGIIVVFSVFFFDKRRVDDPVGAISVHGVCGAFGTLMVGFLATESGLLYGGGVDQLITQAIGVVAVFAFVTITSGLLFLAIKATIGLRVPPEEEMTGLDVIEHGSPGYGPDILTTAPATG
jgi:Amt family ammonium transporter